MQGISYVVDVGYVKSRFYEASNGTIYLSIYLYLSLINIFLHLSLYVSTGIESLKVVPISQSQANQRTGIFYLLIYVSMYLCIYMSIYLYVYVSKYLSI
jgi:hypothetical protein